MLFTYRAVDSQGKELEGSYEAHNKDMAITALQRQGYVISSIEEAEKKSMLEMNFSMGSRVTNRDIVIVSRQISTLFEAQVSALRIFRLLASEAQRPGLQKVLTDVADELQGGASISKAMAKHPKVFSPFYVNMVRSGEETGKLDSIFSYLADYMDRTYEITMKARNALIYPAFVVMTFIVVVILMLTLVFPKIGDILEESGQEVPVYTKIILWLGDFFHDWGFIVAIAAIIGAVFAWRSYRTAPGRMVFDQLKVRLPGIKILFVKLYLSRISDNLATMLTSGITVTRALEVTAAVVDNKIYENLLLEALHDVKNGSAVSKALSRHPEIPGIMVQMIKVGEETGEVGNILNTLAKFYRREVETAVDTLVDLIEPAMIVVLGLGVGILLASVLLPIYNITTSI